VPDRAIQHGPDGLFVYVIDDQNRAAVRPVAVSHEDEDLAVIDKGLNDGDRVVTVGQYGLQPGARVGIDASASTGS
jgi:multidrug efflux system membrane fusion protein